MIQGALRDGGRRASKARSTRFSFLCASPSTWTQRNFTKAAAQEVQPSKSTKPSKAQPFERFEDRSSPNSRIHLDDAYIKQCIAGLVQLVPPHLRAPGERGHDPTPGQTFSPDVLGIAEFLLRTERIVAIPGGQREHLDLLHRLAVEQGRWKLVVWLIKIMVETFHLGVSKRDRLSQTIQQWNRHEALDVVTIAPLYRKPSPDDTQSEPHIEHSVAPTLDALTDSPDASDDRVDLLWHDALGLVWRSLGRMTIACATRFDIAGGGMKPEVLEMVALLHHHEFMPVSIYSQQPPENDDAIQQPPTLHLLSSRILTSLSDAVWRAREVTTGDEARPRGSIYQALYARMPGMFSRSQVAGLKPEIWLELVLWSSLHGGWIAQGADVLRYVYKEKSEEEWMPVSWRDGLRSVMPFGQVKLLEWDGIKYLFDTNNTQTDSADVLKFRVDKTISSEVVNAYIDALLNHVYSDVDSGGFSFTKVFKDIKGARGFLKRADLNLGSGTWDATVFRLLESSGLHVFDTPRLINQFLELLPKIGQELNSGGTSPLPAYVLDGSAAIFGLLHRTLRSSIAAGKLEDACNVFNILQERIDDDRRKSLADFFANKHVHAALSDTSTGDMFTENFPGIDHPSLDYKLPPETAAAFLNLATDSKSYELGNWMVSRSDLDGPMIPQSYYQNPHVSAAMIRFATATNNKSLIARIVGAQSREEGGKRRLPREVLEEFLDVQINSRNWSAATKILEYMRDARADLRWSNSNAASLARQMMLASIEGDADIAESDFASSASLFVAMYSGKFDAGTELNDNSAVLPLVLALVNQGAQAVCHRAGLLPQRCSFDLKARGFNIILETVGQINGARVAAQLVSTFWRRKAWYPLQDKSHTSFVAEPGFWTLPRNPADPQDERPPRRRYRPQCSRSFIVVSGHLAPNHLTFKTVFQCALDEYARLSSNAVLTQSTSKTDLDESQEKEQKLSTEDASLASHTTLLYTKGTGNEVLDVFVWVLLSMRRAGFGISDADEQLTEVLNAQDRAAVTQVVGDEEAHEYNVTHGRASAKADETDLAGANARGSVPEAPLETDERVVAWYAPKRPGSPGSKRKKAWYKPRT